MDHATTNTQLKSRWLILSVLAVTLFINTGILSAHKITFDESRYVAVYNQLLYRGGPNTLIDTELNLDFYVAYGEMYITRVAHVGWYNYMLYFTPYTPSVTDPVGRVVITFDNLQQYVRIDVSTDGTPVHDNAYLRVSYYKDTNPTNPIYTHDGPGQNIEYTDAQNGIKMLIVDTKYAENNIEELEFYELGQSSQTYPPSGVVALSNYSGAIPVAWQIPTSGQSAASVSEPYFNPKKNPIILGSSSEQSSHTLALQYYKIYRSTSQNGTYTQIATNITHPYYRDANVTNGQTYYYKVKAVYDAGESDFSNSASATALSNGNTIASGWAGSAPTLDGVIGSGEWSAAGVADITAPGESNSVTLYVMNNNEYLYLAVDDMGNTSLNQYDTFALIFDENHDWEWPSSNTGEEGILQVYWNSGATHAYQAFYGQWPDQVYGSAWSVPAGVNYSISSSSGHLKFEIRLNLTTGPLNVSAGDVFNVFFYTYEGGSGTFTGIWPKETIENLPSLASGYAWAHGAFSYGEMKMSDNTGVEDRRNTLPSALELSQNYPNPFNASTMIPYYLPGDTHITLQVVDSQGRTVRVLENDTVKRAGNHTARWDGTDDRGFSVASGIYIVRLKADASVYQRKLILIK
jgi:hypothetical protein